MRRTISLSGNLKPLLCGVALLLATIVAISSALAQSPAPRPRVIVFVHGIHGNRETWRAPNGAFWPDMLRSDPRFAFSDIEVAEYPTPASNGKMSSVRLAEVLWNVLQRQHVWDHREVVFLAHSLGGILVEEMLLRHPADAARVRFIVSYGTPHQGSTIARLASLYDKDPLLNDLSDADNNTFLTNLEQDWRAHDSVNGIHRFCAYETEDTRPDSGFGRYLRTHARVVGYFSATYGCDVTTPPSPIQADHLNLVKPLDRTSAAYDFFYRVYRDNPVLQQQLVTRSSTVPDLLAGCDQTNQNPDFPVPVALDDSLHEKVIAATAAFIDTRDLHNVDPSPPAVTRIDPNGVAHVRYGFSGPGKLLFVCHGTARASLQVQFSIIQQLPLREPQN